MQGMYSCDAIDACGADSIISTSYRLLRDALLCDALRRHRRSLRRHLGCHDECRSLNSVRPCRGSLFRMGDLLLTDILLHFVHRLRLMLLRRMGVAENHVDL